MQHLLTKWHPEDDPIVREQYQVLLGLVGDMLTEAAVEGFLIMCSRLVDNFGHHRTQELATLFSTHKREGKRALVASLEYVKSWTGGMEAYQRLYPVTIIPPQPAFVQLKMVGIDTIAPYLYRVMDSQATVPQKDVLVKEYILQTGHLPPTEVQTLPVLRSKPYYHWCTYEAWPTPELTSQYLQILPEWNTDCRLRARIATKALEHSAFLAFNGDRDTSPAGLQFHNYFYEPLAQDHPAYVGGGAQIGLDGSPRIDRLELWDESKKKWQEVFKK